ncbi:MAG: hypothetical protein A2322_00300 [Bacteroidetes bacterium RIFOXYB2_FULL_39_7]|nr:MAG: hypothetical protein A2322_00300 [Bacteroidetes bacterium RIFOXYB2_FULL_39_7]
MRTQRYKLIRFYGHDINNWELYDLEKDPAEMNNIYDNPEYGKIQMELHAELKKLMIKYEDFEEEDKRIYLGL